MTGLPCTPRALSLLPDEEKQEEPIASPVSGRQMEKELEAAKVDAQESLLALLQLSEGVRTITRQLQNSTQQDGNPDDPWEEFEEEKKAETVASSSPESSSPESFVTTSCLHGTVFGTDLLRLWDAAQQVQSYARLVVEESTISANDIAEAHSTACEAVQRAERAELRVGHLSTKCHRLAKRNAKLLQEKRVLIQEVKALRRQLVTGRKQEMERLLQHHVAGALLLHEEQLKQLLQQQRQREAATAANRTREEEKKDDDNDLEEVVVTTRDDAGPDEADQDLQVIQPDDVSEVEEVHGVVDRDAIAKAIAGDVTDEHTECTQSEQRVASPSTNNEHNKPTTANLATPPRGTSDSSMKTPPPTTAPCIVSPPNILHVLGFGSGSAASGAPRIANVNATIQNDAKPIKDSPQKSGGVKTKVQDSKINASVNNPAVEYNPVKLLAKGRWSPVSSEHQNQNQTNDSAPDSSRSLSSAASSVPEFDDNIHMGKKVMRFFLDPGAHAAAQEAAARAKRQQQLEQQKLQNNKPPLLQLDNHDDDKEETPETNNLLKSRSMSGDGTTMTATATATPTSTSCFGGLAKVVSCDKHGPIDSDGALELPVRFFPSSVSFADDASSIQSNLPSPLIHPQRSSPSGEDSAEDQRQRQEMMELYNDLKVFRSLAIPSDEEIDDYRDLTTL